MCILDIRLIDSFRAGGWAPVNLVEMLAFCSHPHVSADTKLPPKKGPQVGRNRETLGVFQEFLAVLKCSLRQLCHHMICCW